jgi:hypothetical protein
MEVEVLAVGILAVEEAPPVGVAAEVLNPPRSSDG